MLANRHHPELTPYDRYGNRIDEVAFHPSWHWLMERGIGHGLAATAWEQQEAGDPHAHVRRAAGFFAWSQTEPGHGCPISMTYAAVPALRADDAIAKEWTPLLASRRYDPGVRARTDKVGALAGMGMTEKQGGSDVRANVTAGASDVRGRLLHAARAQVVHQRPDERHLPRPRPGRGRVDLLRGAPRARRRHAQPARRGAAQGQAGQPVQRLLRARARRDPRPAARATRAAACARSSRWWRPPGSTASSARRR